MYQNRVVMFGLGTAIALASAAIFAHAPSSAPLAGGAPAAESPMRQVNDAPAAADPVANAYPVPTESGWAYPAPVEAGDAYPAPGFGAYPAPAGAGNVYRVPVEARPELLP